MKPGWKGKGDKPPPTFIRHDPVSILRGDLQASEIAMQVIWTDGGPSRES